MASTSTDVTLTIKIDPAREEALALADKYVTDWTEQTKNQRGYVHDKWTPVEVMTRTEAVLKVADWLLTRPTILRPPPEPPFATLYGWHPGKGIPEENVYRLAVARREDIRLKNSVVLTAETDMLRQLIDTYESAQADPRDVPPGY